MTQTLSLELYKAGVTVNCVGPAAATRITGTMPGAPKVIEADDVPLDEWNRMDPAVSSPLVAWLASDEADHVTGQVIRAVAENIILMKPWSDGPTINNGQKRWMRRARHAAGDRRVLHLAWPARRSVTFSHAEPPVNLMVTPPERSPTAM
jgi:NAD(P)-dependent dehydrogenase (short-subunit alcohol dehydrogenase family)